MTIEFDSWLESELQTEYASFAKAQIPAGAAYRTARLTPAAPWSPARFATRSAVALAAAALGLMATGALAATAVTGSADPLIWTRHVSVAIAACTAPATSGQPGIGSCVNAIVRHDEPRPNSQRFPGPSGSSRAVPAPAPEVKPGGPSADVSKSAQADTPPASDVKAPDGRPTDPPNGPPAAVPQGPPRDVPGAAHKAQGKPTAPPGGPPATPPGKGP